MRISGGRSKNLLIRTRLPWWCSYLSGVGQTKTPNTNRKNTSQKDGLKYQRVCTRQE